MDKIKIQLAYYFKNYKLFIISYCAFIFNMAVSNISYKNLNVTKEAMVFIAILMVLLSTINCINETYGRDFKVIIGLGSSRKEYFKVNFIYCSLISLLGAVEYTILLCIFLAIDKKNITGILLIVSNLDNPSSILGLIKMLVVVYLYSMLSMSFYLLLDVCIKKVGRTLVFVGIMLCMIASTIFLYKPIIPLYWIERLRLLMNGYDLQAMVWIIIITMVLIIFNFAIVYKKAMKMDI